VKAVGGTSTTRPSANPRIIVIPKSRPSAPAPAEQSDKLVAVAR
jgi:hypothetical protein